MLDTLKKFFSKSDADAAGSENVNGESKLRVATCALFLEMARIDEVFTAAEMESILTIMKEKYGLTNEEADALVAEADRELAESVDLWQFAALINKNYSVAEKVEIIETLWQMVFVDGKMDQY